MSNGGRNTASIIGLAMIAAMIVLGLMALAAMAALAQGQDQGNSNGQYEDAPGQNKVVICHKPGTPAQDTKEVPPTAVPGHLGHGDTLGPCGEATEPETTTPGGATTIGGPENTVPGGGATMVAPPETTPEETTPIVTTPVLPALELFYICTSDGVDRFAIKNLSDEAATVTFKDANGEQSFTVDAHGQYLVDGNVSQGDMPVAQLYYEGTLVDEVSVTREACLITTPPEETIGGTTNIQEIGEPTTGGDSTPVPDDSAGGSPTPHGGKGSVGGNEVPAPVSGGTPEMGSGQEVGPVGNGANAGDASEAIGTGEAIAGDQAGDGAVPNAGPDVVDRVEGDTLPDTGGATLYAAAAGVLFILGGLLWRRLTK